MLLLPLPRSSSRRTFPTALRSYRLPSGPALTRAVYAGKDYSGRWGNFSPIPSSSTGGPGRPRLADRLLRMAGWVGKLAADEDTDQEPEMLPAVDLGDELSASFTCSELSLFLREEPAREGWLASMGQALFASQADRRALVIRSSPLDLPFWIGSLQKLFPPSLAWDWAISTYEDDPRQGAQISGTAGQTYFQFDESELRFRSYGFDVTTGARSEIGPIGRYAATTASWLCHQPEKLESYFRWSEMQGSLGDRRPRGQPRSVPLARRGRPGAGARHRAIGGFGRPPAAGSGAAPQTSGSLLAPRQAAVDRRRIHAVPVSGRAGSETEPDLAAQALDLWRDRAVQALAGRPFRRRAVRSLLAIPDGTPKRAFATASRRWAPDRGWLKNVGSSFDRAGLVPFVMAVGAAAGRRRIWRDPAVSLVFRSAAEGELGKENLLVLAGRDGGDLLDLLDLLGRSGGKADRALGRALGKAIAAWPEAAAIRETCEAAEAWEVLFGEWLGRLDACSGAAGRAEEPARYELLVLARLPKFKARALPWVRWSVLSHGSAKEWIAAIHGWLADGSWREFPRICSANFSKVGRPLSPGTTPIASWTNSPVSWSRPHASVKNASPRSRPSAAGPGIRLRQSGGNGISTRFSPLRKVWTMKKT